jgi:alkylation response protein AidB-like acyl-CoA dehydrogenase
VSSLTRVAIGGHDAGRATEWMLAQRLTTVDEVLSLAPQAAVLVEENAASPLDSWEALATLASFDLALARALEPHLDAAGILSQADMSGADPAWRGGAWGVFAAEGGSEPLLASEQPTGWRLTGTKPWCSLAGQLDFALVTAHVDDRRRGLFAIDLRDGRIAVATGQWHARGLTEIVSSSIHLQDVAGTAVGEPGWYLERPGFDIGGIGVAACWFGGAVGIARTVFEAGDGGGSPLAAMHLGAVDISLQQAQRALADAAASVEAGVDSSSAKLLAKRVRGTVARTVEEVLWRAGHVLGPGPLAQDAAHAKRVADLELYVRQHHAERDDESLGRLLRQGEAAPW